jgi:nucleotide-binding universal stress UspA family protein
VKLRPRRNGAPSRTRRKVATGYQRILVPLSDDPGSESAIDLACRLAAEKRSAIAAVVVIEIPPTLPLDAHMLEEEEDAERLLDRAEAVGDSYGVLVSPHVIHAREAAGAIAEEARKLGTELIVIGGSRNHRRSSVAPIFDTTIQDVLRKAPCRVMVLAEQLDAAAVARTASTAA